MRAEASPKHSWQDVQSNEGGTMHRWIGPVFGAALVIGMAGAWRASGSAAATVTVPAQATYATHLVGNPKNTSSWHAQVVVATAPGWYTYKVASTWAPSCWLTSVTGAAAWPVFYGSGGTTGVLHVVTAGVKIVFKCANGSKAGVMFVTLAPTTMSGTP
jgi:hypothetical protein